MKNILTFLILLTVSFGFAQPTTDAPTPSKATADVISIFSDAYTDVATNYNPSWSQSGSVNTTYDPTGGGTNNVLAYTNFDYQGTELTTQNAAAMEYLHVDLWTSADPANTDIQISPINNGTGAGEVLVSITYTSGSWISVDIAKSSFTGMTWDSVHQLKVAANATGSTYPVDIYLDNIYFWKAPLNTNTDATLSDLQVDNTTITGFSGALTSYTYELPDGTTTVPQITSATATQAAGGATTAITQATAVPGNATVLVTAPDGTTTQTYTVSYVDNLPATAAPTPPARAAADVISLYSDAYTDVASNFDAGWCGSNSVTEVMVGGNAAQKYLGNACQGIVLSNAIDASGFTHYHVDIFIAAGTDLTGKTFHLKFVGTPTTVFKEVTHDINGLGLKSGKWISFDGTVDLSTMGGFKEFGITSNLNDKVWYDNLYVHKNTVLGIGHIDTPSFAIYPNPMGSQLTVEGVSEVQHASIFDLTGREVLRATPNKAVFTLDTADLQHGVYMLSLQVGDNEITKKLMK